MEQIHETEIRIAVETTIGAGVTESEWIQPPAKGWSVTRGFSVSFEKLDVFRNPSKRDFFSEEWILVSSHERGSDFFNWIIQNVLTDRGSGVFTADPEAIGKTFVIQAKASGGSHSRFSGCAISEIRIQGEESRIVSFDLTWIALKRSELEEENLPEAEQSWSGGLTPTKDGQVAITEGEWSADPRTEQAINAFAYQVFLQREIKAVSFGPDGIPKSFSREPWKFVGELFTEEKTGFTDLAYAESWAGKIAIWFGKETANLRIEKARAFVTDDELKGYDFRIKRLLIEGHGDHRRSVVEIRD